MLVAYFDASGSSEDPNSTILTVAGFVSTEQKWTVFEREWRSTLAAEGFQRFHMKEFAHFRGQFEGWRQDEQKRRRLLGNLSRLIGQFAIKEISVSMLLHDYREVDAVYQLSEFAKPYPLTAMQAVTTLEKWLVAHRSGEPVRVVFEKGDADQAQFRKVMESARLTPSFRGKDECVPLQASDFLAYEHAKSLKDAFESGKRMVRESCFSLIKESNAVGNKWLAIGTPVLVAFCEAFRVQKRDRDAWSS